jgi:hypothetical protein
LTQNQTSPAALIGCLKRCRRGRNRICSFSRAAVTIAQLLKGGEADGGGALLQYGSAVTAKRAV